jgi:molecular chaperone GrpE
MHDESDTVDDPTCTKVLRPGYKHGDRLLRPAMVGVTDPVHPVHPAQSEAVAEPTAAETHDEQKPDDES